MVDENKKEGISVKEIEELANKHRFEIFFCLLFLLAFIFGVVGILSTGWSVFLGMLGSVLGFIFPEKMDRIIRKIVQFAFKQEKTIQIVFGVIALVLACIVPCIIFLIIGTVGGRGISQMVSYLSSKP